MTTARTLAVALGLAAVCLAVPGGAAAAQTPAPACNGGGCGGWFRSSVTVTWSYDAGATSTQGCGTVTVTDDTSGATFACTVWYGTPFFGNSVTVRKDSSPPSVSVSPSRGPDSDGWYTKPVAFSVTGDDGASGVSSCTSGTYSGPDGTDARLSGSCTDNAGNTGSGSTSIRYDATPPKVAAAPARAPDANGWYNHPVQVAFAGTDAGSGVKECSPPVDYKGPDASPARLVGQCRDVAGNLSDPVAFELRYDASPPARPKVSLAATAGSVRLSWTASKDAVLAEVVRAPGVRGSKPATVFRGKGRRFVDIRAKGNVRYWYEVRLYDQAGNRSASTVNRRPLRGVFAPVEGAVVRGVPPVVEWASVSKARFYNLQLWRGRAKVLTTWLTTTRFQVPRTWTYQRKRRSLASGRYRVFVFPAFGTAANPRFGELVGQVGLVVKRR
jgi:hypothetical protein